MNGTDYSHVDDPIGDSVAATTLIFVSGFVGILFSLYQFYNVRKTNIVSASESEHTLLTEITSIKNECPLEIISEHPQSSETEKLFDIYNAITKGANAFLLAEYKYMGCFLFFFSFVIFLLVGSADNCGDAKVHSGNLEFENGSCWNRGLLTAVAFVLGGITSILSGYIGMRIAVYSNVRTTIGAQISWTKAFNNAFRAGAVMGFSLCSLALMVLYGCILLFHINWNLNVVGNAQALFECIAGFGLGGSSIALFGRVGGGIYTKAADVGADLVGKIEQGIPEDDIRNPAVIADNVGDNVGDVAGMGTDLFGSFAEATCAALILSSISPDLNSNWCSLIFPLLISSIGILSCMITTFVATTIKKVRKEADVEKSLKWQLIISTVLTTPLLWIISYVFLPDKFCVQLSDDIQDLEFSWTDKEDGLPIWCDQKSTNHLTFVCIATGLWAGLLIGYFTEYMTSHSYKPVREVAEVSTKGAGVNIIYGLALGYMSTIVPAVALAATIYVSLELAGMYGIAMAALGMLSTLAIGLTIDCYGPVSDNAGGIAEMAGLSENVRNKTDALDSAGNTTAAIGKGFAIGSASLVSLALFGAFVSRTNLHDNIDILKPITFAGLLVGSMYPYWFSAMTMKSVGKAAQEMVEEVRRQFREHSGIMTYEETPDYEKCVKISTEASLKEMIAPGLLVILSPIIIGFFFGTHAVIGLLVGSLISSVQLAVSSSNTGGAWDNAKKYIEKGHLGGKGSDAHNAAVTGDTVGDPMKDTSGPSLNILMKLMAIISLVFADFFVKHSLV